MQPEALQSLALEALDELQAIDIVHYDVRTLTTITDYMIICSGRSTTHVKSIAEHVIKCAKTKKVSHVAIEGEGAGEWVLVDLGSVVVHVMLPATRDFYKLEDLWEPIKLAREQRGS